MYYTYELVDPRCGSVFYIGKGKGERRNQHLREALKGVDSPKCQRIRDILDAGHEFTSRITKHFENEVNAYEHEAALIKQFGLDNLTNIAAGGVGWQRDVCPIAAAKRDLRQCAKDFRKYIMLHLAGVQAFYQDCDLIGLCAGIAYKMRDQVGVEVFNKIVWGGPEWVIKDIEKQGGTIVLNIQRGQ